VVDRADDPDSRKGDDTKQTYCRRVRGGDFTALLPSGKGASEPAAGEANLPDATISLSGPWGFYQAFRGAHGLRDLAIAKEDEIAVKAGTLLSIPLKITHTGGKAVEVKVKVTAPEDWKVIAGEGNFSLPEEWFTAVSLEIQSPSLTAEEVKKEQPREVVIGWGSERKARWLSEVAVRSFGRVRCRRISSRSWEPQLFFTAGGFKLLPVRIREHQQVVKFAAPCKPLAAVDHYAFAVYILRHIADQECREIA